MLHYFSYLLRRNLRYLKFGLSRFHQSEDLSLKLMILLDHFDLGILANQHVKARLLLKVGPISPLITGLGIEIFLELLDGIILFEEVLDLRGEGVRSELALFVPQVPLVSVLPFKKLDNDISSLLILIIGDVIELELASIVIENDDIFDFAVSIYLMTLLS